MDVDAVAEELYALPREEFTAARDARAKAARDAGDRDLATAIGKLRDLIELGEALREAHTSLDGATLQELSRQRHQVVHALIQRARALGCDAGTPVSEAVTRELEETITAALSDEDAARALIAGRLATGIAPGEGWFAAGGTTPQPVAVRPPSERTDDGTQERLAQELADARAAAQEAVAAQREAQRAVEDAESRAREAAETVEDLARRLADAEQTRHAADQELCFARRSVDGADEHVADAERRIRDLEARLRHG